MLDINMITNMQTHTNIIQKTTQPTDVYKHDYEIPDKHTSPQYGGCALAHRSSPVLVSASSSFSNPDLVSASLTLYVGILGWLSAKPIPLCVNVPDVMCPRSRHISQGECTLRRSRKVRQPQIEFVWDWSFLNISDYNVFDDFYAFCKMSRFVDYHYSVFLHILNDFHISPIDVYTFRYCFFDFLNVLYVGVSYMFHMFLCIYVWYLVCHLILLYVCKHFLIST